MAHTIASNLLSMCWWSKHLLSVCTGVSLALANQGAITKKSKKTCDFYLHDYVNCRISGVSLIPSLELDNNAI